LTGKEELKFRLSQRISYFLENSPPKRYEMFQILKTAYDIRSATVHGAKIKKNLEDIKRISIMIDDILRRILNKIISNNELKLIFAAEQKEFEKYMDKLIFDIN